MAKGMDVRVVYANEGDANEERLAFHEWILLESGLEAICEDADGQIVTYPAALLTFEEPLLDVAAKSRRQRSYKTSDPRARQPGR